MEYNELINGFAEKFAIADLKIDNDATALSIDGIRVEIVHDTVLNEVMAIAEIGAPPPDANGPFAELDPKEKNKVYIVTSLLSQETGKNKLGGIPGTFAEEFRLDTDAIYTDSAIKFDIKA